METDDEIIDIGLDDGFLVFGCFVRKGMVQDSSHARMIRLIGRKERVNPIYGLSIYCNIFLEGWIATPTTMDVTPGCSIDERELVRGNPYDVRFVLIV